MCHAVWLLLLDEFLDVFDLQIWNMLLCTHVDTKKLASYPLASSKARVQKTFNDMITAFSTSYGDNPS